MCRFEEERFCATCKHEEVDMWSSPCATCDDEDMWEPKEVMEETTEVSIAEQAIDLIVAMKDSYPADIYNYLINLLKREC